MKILHTSDWHIGRTLYGKKRYREFDAFFHWLAGIIEEQKIDALIVAGDIFDTNAPSNRAQAIYYQFLKRVAASPCRHVVVVAGNHDSPSFLDAPRTLLKALDVHVVGQACENLEDEVLLLHDDKQELELIVCAVPYLRDRDLRSSEAGESAEDKERKMLGGLRQHYQAVAEVAEQQRKAANRHIPIVATGHLFTTGGLTQEDDGVRELYVGSLVGVSAATFPDIFDYVALGHLHVPQKVNNCEHIRYCGSPLPMGFGEAKQEKSLCLVELTADARTPTVDVLTVPVFQGLARVKGDLAAILEDLARLAAEHPAGTEKNTKTIWLEVIYQGTEVIPDLREQLDQAVADAALEILRVKNTQVVQQVMSQAFSGESLEDLNLEQVFLRCLDAREVPDNQRPSLLQTYRESIRALDELDLKAE